MSWLRVHQTHGLLLGESVPIASARRRRLQRLMPKISITFINDDLFPDADKRVCHHCSRLVEVTHRLPLTDDVEFHLFELTKFKKTIAELKSGLDN